MNLASPPTKILFLANPNSIHTQRWVNSLKSCGYEIDLFGIKKPQTTFTDYLKLIFPLKKKIKSFQPDILHVHFASNYGFIGALSGFSPMLISAWGEDVFSFPKQSNLRKWILKFNFLRAKQILSTSHTMSNEIKKYSSKKTVMTPFGVDPSLFTPCTGQILNNERFVIGCHKNFYKIYGHETLLKAFAQLKKTYPKKLFRLVLIGSGPEKNHLINLANRLNIHSDCTFVGSIAHEDLPKQITKWNISVIPSLHESFGVSLLEVMACGIPLIASNIPAFSEISMNGNVAELFTPKNANSLFQSLDKLFKQKEKREDFSLKAREHVINNYSWDQSIETMKSVYENHL